MVLKRHISFPRYFVSKDFRQIPIASAVIWQEEWRFPLRLALHWPVDNYRPLSYALPRLQKIVKASTLVMIFFSSGMNGKWLRLERRAATPCVKTPPDLPLRRWRSHSVSVSANPLGRVQWRRLQRIGVKERSLRQVGSPRRRRCWLRQCEISAFAMFSEKRACFAKQHFQCTLMRQVSTRS